MTYKDVRTIAGAQVLHKRGGGYTGNCDFCSKTNTRIAKREPDGRVKCQTCWSWERAKKCVVCEKDKPVAKKTPEGPLCFACRDNQSHQPCVYFKNTRRVAARLASGSAVCQLCQKKRNSGELPQAPED